MGGRTEVRVSRICWLQEAVRTICLPAVVLAGLAVQSAPAEARNLFQILFGGHGPAARQASPYAEDLRIQRASDRALYLRQVRREKRALAARKRLIALPASGNDRIAARATGGNASRLRAYVPPKTGAGPLGPFLYDPSLRRGDVVVTAKGLMVFVGRGGAQHRAGDFRTYAVARRSAGGPAARLNAIARANRKAATALVRPEVVKTYRKPAAAQEVRIANRR